jgi:hypothetical protein
MTLLRSLRNTILLIVKYIFYRIELGGPFLYMIWRGNQLNACMVRKIPFYIHPGIWYFMTGWVGRFVLFCPIGSSKDIS